MKFVACYFPDFTFLLDYIKIELEIKANSHRTLNIGENNISKSFLIISSRFSNQAIKKKYINYFEISNVASKITI